MQESIYIIANYCGELDGRMSNRFVYLSSMLSQKYQVTLITSNFHHSTKRRKIVMGKYNFKIEAVHEMGYSRNIGVKRLLSHYFFSRNVRKRLKELRMPDLIYVSFPTYSLGISIIPYANRNHVPLVFDVQDLWPEAFENVLSKLFFGGYLVNWLKKGRNRMFARAEGLVVVSNTFSCAIEQEIKLNSVFVCYIGAFWAKGMSDDLIISRKSKTAVDFVYLGSLGDSYDLELVLDSFSIIVESSKANVFLHIIGEGEKKEMLTQKSKQLGLPVKFYGLIDHQTVQEILPRMDVAINPIVPWSSASIINKHADYAMACLPVINTQKNDEYRELLEHYQAGINVKHEKDSIVSAMYRMIQEPEERVEMSYGMRKLAIKFDRRSSYLDLVRYLEKHFTRELSL